LNRTKWKKTSKNGNEFLFVSPMSTVFDVRR
jgi:hypothetical protein